MTRATYFPNGISRAVGVHTQLGYAGLGIGDVIETLDDFTGDTLGNYDLNDGQDQSYSVDVNDPLGIMKMVSDDGSTTPYARVLAHAVFQAGQGEVLMMHTRFSVDNGAATSNLGYALGLTPHDTSWANVDSADDSVLIAKDRGDANWRFELRGGGNSLGSVQFSDDLQDQLRQDDLTVFHEAIIWHDGKNTWRAYINDGLAAEIVDTAGILNSQPWGPSWLCTPTASTSTCAMHVDYVACAQKLTRE